MLLKKTNKYFVLVIIAAFLFGIMVNPSKADAQWVDKSGDLPGMDGGSSAGTIIAIAAVGIAVVGLLYYFKVKKNKKTGAEKKEIEQPSEESEVDSFDSSYLKRVSESKLKSASLEKNSFSKKSKVSVKPYLDFRNDRHLSPDQNNFGSNLKDRAVIVGLSAKF